MVDSEVEARRCLTVVMPCFNEAATVQQVIRAVLASPFVAELIVVDDASWDGTADLVEEIDDPRVKLLRQAYNQGKGAALRRGFREATSPYVVVQDADLEYDPVDFGELLAPLLDGHADVVYGSRFQTSRSRRVLYFWHSAGNRFLTLLSNMFTNLNLTDMETGYKIFKREVLESFELRENRFGIEPELTARIANGGWRLYEVPISYHGRSYDEGKKIGWRDGVRAIYCIVRYSRPGQKVLPVHAPAVDAGVALEPTLESMSEAQNYTSWLLDLVRPYLGKRLLEVGAGEGTFTEHFREVTDVIVAEPEDMFANRLRERFGDDPRVTIVHGDVHAAAALGPFDSVVLLNVLEHIHDDFDSMQQLTKGLLPGGHVVVFAPAFASLYSSYDREIGHHRRYTAPQLESLLTAVGLEVVESRYVNRIGAIAWFISARLLGQRPTVSGRVRLYDRIGVPISRLTERDPRFGQSVLAVGRLPFER